MFKHFVNDELFLFAWLIMNFDKIYSILESVSHVRSSVCINLPPIRNKKFKTQVVTKICDSFNQNKPIANLSTDSKIMFRVCYFPFERIIECLPQDEEFIMSLAQPSNCVITEIKNMNMGTVYVMNDGFQVMVPNEAPKLFSPNDLWDNTSQTAYHFIAVNGSKYKLVTLHSGVKYLNPDIKKSFERAVLNDKHTDFSNIKHFEGPILCSTKPGKLFAETFREYVLRTYPTVEEFKIRITKQFMLGFQINPRLGGNLGKLYDLMLTWYGIKSNSQVGISEVEKFKPLIDALSFEYSADEVIRFIEFVHFKYVEVCNEYDAASKIKSGNVNIQKIESDFKFWKSVSENLAIMRS